MSELTVLLDGRKAGTLLQKRGRLTFFYADSWRFGPGAYPLSLSMPLNIREHTHTAVDPFLWGLLPDNEFVLARWAQRFHVSPRNAFALLEHVGEDCAGAVQFVLPGSQSDTLALDKGEIEWLDEAGVGERLRTLRTNAAAGRTEQDAGLFSLAGAQPKTALYYDGERWGVPSGRIPTTHILKPPAPGLDGHAENEHLCLSLARALGLPAALSTVQTFGDVTAFVVERYDRVKMDDLAAQYAALAAQYAALAATKAADLSAQAVAEAADAAVSSQVMANFARTTPIYRVHQEDFCQALGIHPSKKYQNEGGPGPLQITNLLRNNASSVARRGRRKSSAEMQDSAPVEDVTTFIDALIFNWLIGGTDAHAKNYSLLIGGDGLVRLAPLYDLASIFGYPNIEIKKAKLAMKVGDKYTLVTIGLSDWIKLAANLKIDGDALVARIRNMTGQLPDHLSGEIKKMRASGLDHKTLDILATVLPDRARHLGKI